eukprot:4058983-Prymnesium_polylepis.1
MYFCESICAAHTHRGRSGLWGVRTTRRSLPNAPTQPRAARPSQRLERGVVRALTRSPLITGARCVCCALRRWRCARPSPSCGTGAPANTVRRVHLHVWQNARARPADAAAVSIVCRNWGGCHRVLARARRVVERDVGHAPVTTEQVAALPVDAAARAWIVGDGQHGDRRRVAGGARSGRGRANAVATGARRRGA